MDESGRRHRNWAAVECPGCFGRGTYACAVCHGLGAVCPTCRGDGWVLDDRIPIGLANRLMHCPACNGSFSQAAVIVRGVLT
jgi:DnaJ-class molecular chaperone